MYEYTWLWSHRHVSDRATGELAITVLQGVVLQRETLAMKAISWAIHRTEILVIRESSGMIRDKARLDISKAFVKRALRFITKLRFVSQPWLLP